MLAQYQAGTPEFDQTLARLQKRGGVDLTDVEPVVRQILSDIERNHGPAVIRYVEAYERRLPKQLVRRDDGNEFAAALDRLPSELADALRLAAQRIGDYHRHQSIAGFSYADGDLQLGMRVLPLSRVGVYAPGGKARYPSSVLMSAIPARIAGVPDIVLATPLRGELDPAGDDVVLGAAHLAGIKTIVDAGGAHAIAAMAYGVDGCAPVDKIVGPGNVYVTCAKRLLYGTVDIDGLAGPSEVVVLADESADPALVAADLICQAEHDEAAVVVLVTTDATLPARVNQLLEQEVPRHPRADIISEALGRGAAALIVADLPAMIEIGNRIGGEHVAIHVADAERVAEQVHNGGALFVGSATPVAAGDYLAGPSHVLPTGAAVRFGSPLGVYDFVKRQSLVHYKGQALASHADAIAVLAEAEGLPGHAASVRIRAKS